MSHSEPLPLFPSPTRSKSTGWVTCPTCQRVYLVITVDAEPDASCLFCAVTTPPPTSERVA